VQGDEQIREALERNVKAVSLRAGLGKGTATTTAVLRPGLDCTVTEGPFELKVGMSTKSGGRGDAPNPGVLGRGALASCLAICYGMWAARLGVPCDAIEVEVQADYSEIRYVVTVVSASPEQDVLRVLDTADRYSAYRDVFANDVPLRREVRITAGTV